jgi:serine/threonine-protein kinase
MRPRALLLPLLLALALTRAARADSSAEDRAAADALYEEAGKLMAAERWAEACPKLEASLKLDPGIGTTLRLAQCYEKTGRTASAWSLYSDAEAMARRVGDKRAEEAARRVKLMEPLLSRLLLDVAPENRAIGAEIKRDGKVIDAGAWGAAMPLDPGPHVIEASAPGRVTWRSTITIEPRPGKTSAQVPPLQPAPAGSEPVIARPFWGPQRVAGAAVGGVGVLGLVVGAALGGAAIGKNNASKAECDPKDPRLCSQAGVDARGAAGRLADASTAMFVIGGAAAAAGLTVFLTVPKGGDAKTAALGFRAVPVFGPGAAGLSLRGEW